MLWLFATYSFLIISLPPAFISLWHSSFIYIPYGSSSKYCNVNERDMLSEITYPSEGCQPAVHGESFKFKIWCSAHRSVQSLLSFCNSLKTRLLSADAAFICISI